MNFSPFYFRKVVITDEELYEDGLLKQKQNENECKEIKVETVALKNENETSKIINP